MDNQWQVGDLALCVRAGRWREAATLRHIQYGPRVGQLLHVMVVLCGSTPDEKNLMVLGFEECGQSYTFCADHFIRVTPDDLEEDELPLAHAQEPCPVRAQASKEPLTQDEIAKRLKEVEALLQRKELGRFHPELGDVYDQLVESSQRRLDKTIRITLIQKRLRLQQGKEY